MMKDQITNLARCLNLSNPIIISSSPDVRNVYFVLEEKKKGDAITLMEDIFVSEIEKLRKEKNNYPVTLMFMPLQYMAHAMRYAKKVFKNPSVEESLYVSIFSNQDKAVNEYVMKQLKMENPHIRLIFCTSVIGMGFDSPSVCNIIHVRPPRNLSNYMQEVGRAGRRGQQAKAIIYFNLSDIAPNVPGLQRDIVDLCTLTTCIREYILGHFGFKKDESSPIGCKCCNICCKKCLCEDCKLALHVSELNL
ncbi:hypothetical protein FSP39_000453 [Pinctada imbricata]|uniref:DNA 3'-5' helicase n=1 Tax=Pinctada imbricata TaxID=66713 RepID=A0AA88XM10_PINIB|nr:hypothetical protein FSP39_000453 [Pinctada imbricata]